MSLLQSPVVVRDIRAIMSIGDFMAIDLGEEKEDLRGLYLLGCSWRSKLIISTYIDALAET